jgi:hypothetical protein
MKAKLYLVIFLCFLAWPTLGQKKVRTISLDLRREINFEAFIEEVFAVQDEDIDYEDLYENLLQLYLHPVDLNSAGRQELQSLYILSELQINSILNYKKEFGNFLSIYELQAVPDLDLGTIYKILPFISFDQLNKKDKPLNQRLLSAENNYFFLRYERTLQERKGYNSAEMNSRGQLSQRYLGSPDKLYSRFRISNPKDFSLGFTLEKDPGEQIIWDPSTNRYGADFWSAHFLLQNKGKFKNIVLGDYQLQYGQGLLFGAGFAIGKGAETITTVRRSNLGIRPYTSVMETGFFRGSAATYELKNLELTAFYSNRNINGRRRQIDTTDVVIDYFSSIYASGFHRTPNEIAAKGQINEEVKGAVAVVKTNDRKLNVGATFIQTDFSIPLSRDPKLYNQFEFNGTQNQNYGGFFNYYWKNFNFFGEAARSSSGGTGAVAGFISSLSAKVEMSMLLRDYSRDFHSFYGNSFREGTRNINERGIYWGLKITPSHKFYITSYFDKFEFPWLRYQVNAPSHGYEYLIRANYRPSKRVLLYAQFREEEKGANYSAGTDKLIPVLQGTKRNYIFNMDYVTSSALTLKSRVQFSTYDLGGSSTAGYTIIQDVNYSLRKFRFSSRVALFDTDDWRNRQYVYERNVLYAFSLPAYHGRGIRTYLLAQYNMSRKTTFWIRYANTNLRDRETIGSNLEMIDGNRRSDITCQVRYKF